MNPVNVVQDWGVVKIEDSLLISIPYGVFSEKRA